MTSQQFLARVWEDAPGLLSFVASLGLTGCVAVGPQSVAPDRIDYATAITESWKRPTLLNIVNRQ